MEKNISVFVAGLIFGLGLALSGMTHASKVLGFLDVAGDWDPSLALVMGAGLLVNFVFFRMALRRGAPLFASTFCLPPTTALDARAEHNLLRSYRRSATAAR